MKSKTYTFTTNELHIIDQALAHYEESLNTKRKNLLKWSDKSQLYVDRMERTKQKLQVAGSLIGQMPFEFFQYNQTKVGA